MKKISWPVIKINPSEILRALGANTFLLFLLSCSSAGEKNQDVKNQGDSCSIAKKFDSYQIKEGKVKPDYTGEIVNYWDAERKIVKEKHLYKNGELVKSTYYWDNEKLRFEHQLKCKSLHGEQKYYYENGRIEKTLVFSYGYRKGAGLFYDENGKLLEKVDYSGDSIIGKPVYYDSIGKVISADTVKIPIGDSTAKMKSK